MCKALFVVNQRENNWGLMMEECHVFCSACNVSYRQVWSSWRRSSNNSIHIPYHFLVLYCIERSVINVWSVLLEGIWLGTEGLTTGALRPCERSCSIYEHHFTVWAKRFLNTSNCYIDVSFAKIWWTFLHWTETYFDLRPWKLLWSGSIVRQILVSKFKTRKWSKSAVRIIGHLL